MIRKRNASGRQGAAPPGPPITLRVNRFKLDTTLEDTIIVGALHAAPVPGPHPITKKRNLNI